MVVVVGEHDVEKHEDQKRQQPISQGLVFEVSRLFFREDGKRKYNKYENECQIVVFHLQYIVGKDTPSFQHESDEDEQAQLSQFQEIEDET